MGGNNTSYSLSFEGVSVELTSSSPLACEKEMRPKTSFQSHFRKIQRKITNRRPRWGHPHKTGPGGRAEGGRQRASSSISRESLEKIQTGALAGDILTKLALGEGPRRSRQRRPARQHGTCPKRALDWQPSWYEVKTCKAAR